MKETLSRGKLLRGLATTSLALLLVVGSAQAAVTVTSTAMSTGAATALSVSTGTTGILTLDSGTTGAVNLGTGENAKIITVGNAASTELEANALLVDINAGATGMTVDSAGALSLDAADTSNLTVTGSAKNLALAVAGGGAQVLSINSAGTGTNAIDIDVTGTGGGLDVDTTDGGITLTAAGATNGDITLTAADDLSILGGSAGSILNFGTNNHGNAINIGTNNTTADTINIGSALDTTNIVSETVFDNSANVSYTAQAITEADDGNGTSPTTTITPTSTFVRYTCGDGNGCNITLSETGARDGQTLVIIQMVGSGTLADTSGVIESAGTVLAQYDSAGFVYANDRWVQLYTNNN